jgi:hypothetical protein
MRKLNLYELLKMIDCSDLELPLYADEKGKIACEPQSVYKVTLRFSAEENASVTVPISSPLLIPWYDCVVYSFSPNDVEDSLEVWLEYNEYVLKKWSSKIIQEVSEDAGSKTD